MLKKSAVLLTVSFALLLSAAAPDKQEFKAPALQNPQSWTMVVVPDIQSYIRRIQCNGILDMMLTWVVHQKKNLNIQQVLFTGDLVYYNQIGVPARGVTDLIGKEQWKATSSLLERLDNKLPYILCTGNHDYGERTAENRLTNFNEFFKTDRNPLSREQLVECGPNTFGVRTLENAAYEFTAPAPDGRKFLVITLQFAPAEEQLKWAKKIADTPRFANHIGIVLTHSYMYANGKRIEKEKYGVNKRHGGQTGEQIFRKLVYPAKNIRLVVCGHVCAPEDWSQAVGFAVDKNSSGKTVSQMVFNTQAIGGGFSGSGGDGWLRLLEFMPDGKTVKATTFSPYFAISPRTCHLAWKTDARNEFTFTIE